MAMLLREDFYGTSRSSDTATVIFGPVQVEGTVDSNGLIVAPTKRFHLFAKNVALATTPGPDGTPQTVTPAPTSVTITAQYAQSSQGPWTTATTLTLPPLTEGGAVFNLPGANTWLRLTLTGVGEVQGVIKSFDPLYCNR